MSPNSDETAASKPHLSKDSDLEGYWNSTHGENNSVVKKKKYADMDKNELFEIILRDIGGWGIYQNRMLVLALLPCFLCSFNHIAPVFIGYKQDFACLGENQTRYIYVF